MKHNQCPICRGFVVVSKIYPYDGYQNETPYYIVGCPECKVGAKGLDKEKTCEKWEKLVGGNK